MRAAILTILAVLVAAVPASPAGDADPWSGVRGLVTFTTDVEAGLRRARFTGRPPMYFLALRDGPCSKRMGETVFRDSIVTKTITERVTPILIDAEVAKEFREKHRLRGTPQTVFVDFDGKAVRVISGAVSARRFRARMKGALAELGEPNPSAEYRRVQALAKKMEKNLAAERWPETTKGMREILSCGTECEFTERAREVRKILERTARRLLRRAKRLIAEDHPRAAEQLLASIPPNFPGLEASREASELLTRLRKRKSEGR